MVVPALSVNFGCRTKCRSTNVDNIPIDPDNVAAAVSTVLVHIVESNLRQAITRSCCFMDQ